MEQPTPDDKKRREPPTGGATASTTDTDAVVRPTKRALSSSESLPPTSASNAVSNETKDPNLLLFQNRAIKIRVEEQKKEIGDRETKIKNLSYKLRTFEETMSCLCRAWDQLNNGLHVLTGRLDFDDTSFDCSVLLPSCNIVESYHFLSNYITEPQALDDNYTFEQLLQNRIKKTQTAFSKIAELQMQYKQINDQSSYLADQSSSFQSSIKELRLELERSTDELTLERKKLIKLQDDIPRIPAVRMPSPMLGGSSSGSAHPSPVNGPVTPKLENGGKDVCTSDEYVELQKQSEARLFEARKLREEKANLTKELQQIHIEIRNIPEERILNSMPYQILRQRLQVVSEELDIKTAVHNKLQHELQQVTVARRMDRESLEAIELQRRLGLDRRVLQLELEATELKSEKEKLINIIDQRNPNIPSQEYIAESRLLLDTKDQDVLKLKKECETLKSNIEKYTDSKLEITRIEQKALRDLETKNLEIKDLFDKLREITRTNEELKQAEKRLTEREKELQLSVELLKSQSSEQTDVIELRISENKLKEEVQSMQKRVQEASDLKAQHVAEIQALQDKQKIALRDLELQVAQSSEIQESQKQEIEALMMEIDSMGKAYEQMQEQNTRLIKQLSDKEDTHAHLMAENIKSQQTIRLAKEAQVSMEEKVARGEDKLKNQADVMAKIDEKCLLLQKQLSKVTEDLHICNFELEKHKRYVRENSAHSTELKTQLDHLGALNSELKKKADDSIFALEREIDKAKRLDEEKHLLKKKLEKLNVTNSPTTSSTPDEELRQVHVYNL
eukprot:gene16367-19474_t